MKYLILIIVIMLISCNSETTHTYRAIAPIDDSKFIEGDFGTSSTTELITSKGTITIFGSVGYIPIGDTLYLTQRFYNGNPVYTQFITWDKLTYREVKRP